MADATYPEDLLYHHEHDWARFDADEPLLATFGITWFAQDALGEVVYFEPPEVGSKVTYSPRRGVTVDVVIRSAGEMLPASA